MKKIIFLIIPITLLFHCNFTNRGEFFTLQPTTDTIFIRIGKKEMNHTLLSQYFTENDTNYLALLNKNRNSIIIYNLDNQSLSTEILIEKQGHNSFQGFMSYVIKNLDTTILIAHGAKMIGLINRKGLIIKKIPIGKDNSGKILFPSHSLLGQRGVLMDSVLFIINENYAENYNGKYSEEMRKKTSVAIKVNIKNGQVKSLPLNYPYDLVGRDIYNLGYSWSNGYDNNFIYIFNILSDLYVTKEFSKFDKIEVKTKYNLNLPKNMSRFVNDFNEFQRYLLTTDCFHTIRYDEYHQCYYLLVRKTLKDELIQKFSNTNFTYPSCFIIILDKSFNHIGDVHFPEDTYNFNNMFISEKGVYISEDHPNNPTYSEDVMRFRLFKLKKL